MLKLIEDVAELSNYTFKLGINNSTVDIALSDEETVSADDFLKMLEYGSPLHSISATRPIERTWLTMKDMIARTYEECVEAIIMKDADNMFVDDQMRMLAQRLCLQLQMFVPQSIKSQISCKVYYKGRKIN